MRNMERATVIDLDGTLVNCNSFTLYVKMMSLRHPAIAFYAILRKLRAISHARAKDLIMGVEISPDELRRFVDTLHRHVRHDVLALAGSTHVILASAAPAAYAGALARRLGIRYCSGTIKGEAENKGDVKLGNVKALALSEGLAVDTVITDHIDDLPLLAANRKGKNILVNPSARLVQAMETAGIPFSRHLG